jgi:NMD protein affecting ribosome stability and mRNA decay
LSESDLTASQADEARLILAAETEDEIDAAICPRCGGGHTRYYLDKRGSFLTWLILGVPVIPALSRMVCADCGRKWSSRG